MDGLTKGLQNSLQKDDYSEPFEDPDDDYPSVLNDETEYFEQTERKKQWRVGSRVVELGVLADGLKGCNRCGQPLQLSSCIGEQKYGLAHVLKIKCNFPSCGLVNEVATSSKHKTSKGGTAWDINSPAATMTRQTVPPADKSGAEHHQIAPSTSSRAQATLGPAATMTRQTVPPADKSGAEHHQIAPSTSSHAQAALGTTKALEGEPPHDSNSAELIPLCQKQIKVSKSIGKEEGSDSCNLNDAIQNLPNVLSKKEKKPNFEKGRVIVGEKGALENLLEVLNKTRVLCTVRSLEKIVVEVLNDEKDLMTGVNEIVKVVHTLEKSVVEVLNEEKDLQTGVTGVLCAEIESSDYDEYSEGQHFSVVEFLGQGCQGSVDLCKDVKTHKRFVRKKLKESSKVEEAMVMLRLEHKNIPEIYGFIIREGVSEILMEYAGTNLQELVKEKKVIEEALVLWSVLPQTLSALKYLWEHQIMHLDIKPLNICINNENVVKLIDFGSAKNATQEQDFRGWTPEYMAPEMCRAFLKKHFRELLKDIDGNFSLTGKVDVFALGLVIQFLLEMIHSQLKYFTERADNPFIYDQTPLRKEIIKTNANDPNTVVKYMLTERGSSALREIIRGLLQGDPNNRLFAEQALLKIEALKKPAETEEELDLK